MITIIRLVGLLQFLRPPVSVIRFEVLEGDSAPFSYAAPRKGHANAHGDAHQSTQPCRCGYTGPDEGHPCHGRGYTCRKPAKHRFYNPRPITLSGMQFKLVAMETFACDACWEART